MRKLIFQNHHYYHIYNRGVDKRKIFLDTRDYVRFIISMRELNNYLYHEQRIYYKNRPTQELSSEASELSSKDNLIDIICYSLIPNHYHLLVKQNAEGGISIFMQKINLSYTHYFNLKYNRSGSLFQGTYKAVEIKSIEHLIYLSAYINANSKVHHLIERTVNYQWCSYPDYLNLRKGNLCDKRIVLDNFKNIDKYQAFVNKTSSTITQERKFNKLILDS